MISAAPYEPTRSIFTLVVRISGRQRGEVFPRFFNGGSIRKNQQKGWFHRGKGEFHRIEPFEMRALEILDLFDGSMTSYHSMLDMFMGVSQVNTTFNGSIELMIN